MNLVFHNLLYKITATFSMFFPEASFYLKKMIQFPIVCVVNTEYFIFVYLHTKKSHILLYPYLSLSLDSDVLIIHYTRV